MQSWISDTEWEPSDNSSSSFHVGAIIFEFIVLILVSYSFPHVINKTFFEEQQINLNFLNLIFGAS